MCSVLAFQFLCLLVLICSSPSRRKASLPFGPSRRCLGCALCSWVAQLSGSLFLCLTHTNSPEVALSSLNLVSSWQHGAGCRLLSLFFLRELPLHIAHKEMTWVCHELLALFWSAQKRYPSFWLSFQHSFPYIVFFIHSGRQLHIWSWLNVVK